MKIGHVEPKVSPASPAKVDRAAVPSGGAANTEPSAKVQLSAPIPSGADEATFDKAKVERISQSIKDGTFKIDAGAIADKLISNAQELLGRSGKA